MNKKYYTVRELAGMFEVDIKTVRRWINEGLLKAYWCKCVSVKGNTEYGGYIVYEADLEDFDPIKNRHSLRMMMADQNRKENQKYLDYLDKRYDDLCNELEIITRTREYLKSIEPYL